MIEFDPSLVSFEFVRLKTITTAVGGSISVVDEKRSNARSEVLHRIEVPIAVARQFLMATKKVNRYLKPVWVCVMKYADHVVCLERHPLGSMGKLDDVMPDGTRRTWTPTCEVKYKMSVLSHIKTSQTKWFFDGRYIYRFNEQDEQLIAHHADKWLTVNGKFRRVMTKAYDTQRLSLQSYKVELEDRTCIAFVSSRGAVSISPPIWRDIAEVGTVQLNRGTNDEDIDYEDSKRASPVRAAGDFNFDQIDKNLAVNLNFALKAGREIGKMFGYEYVEPLHLPRMMIELHTVNLPNVPAEVKATYDINLPFTHAIAWLLGLARRANTLDTYLMMRSVLKYLTQRGIFRKDTFATTGVFQDGVQPGDIKLVPLEELFKKQEGQQVVLFSSRG